MAVSNLVEHVHARFPFTFSLHDLRFLAIGPARYIAIDVYDVLLFSRSKSVCLKAKRSELKFWYIANFIIDFSSSLLFFFSQALFFLPHFLHSK